MIQTKTIAMLLLIAIATIGAIGIGTTTQSAQAGFGHFDTDDSHGQSIHDSNGDHHCHQVNGVPVC